MNGEMWKRVFDAVDSKRPVKVRLGKVGYFPGKDYDVVYAEVDSDGVQDLHERLAELPHQSSFRDYRAHVTIAKVKPGLGAIYALRLGSLDLAFMATVAVYSDKDDQKHYIPLGRTITVQKAAMSYLATGTGGALVAPAAQGRAISLRRKKPMLARVRKALDGIVGGAVPFDFSSLTNPNRHFDSRPVDPELFIFGAPSVTKAFDAQAHPREKTAHDTKRPGEFAPKAQPSLFDDESQQPAARPKNPETAFLDKKQPAAPAKKKPVKLTDDQRELLRQLAEEFPDGVAHLLDSSGKIEQEHLETDEDREARERIPKHEKAHAALNAKIAARHKANDVYRSVVAEDEAINEAINNLPTSDIFNTTDVETPDDAAEEVDELNTSLYDLSKFLEEIEQSEMLEYDPDGPDPDNYADYESLPDEGDYDSPSDWEAEVAHSVTNRHDEHKALSEDSDEWANDIAAKSEKFRAEQRGYLERLVADYLPDVLKHDAATYASLFGTDSDYSRKEAERVRKEAERLQNGTTAILKRLSAKGR